MYPESGKIRRIKNAEFLGGVRKIVLGMGVGLLFSVCGWKFCTVYAGLDYLRLPCTWWLVTSRMIICGASDQAARY